MFLQRDLESSAPMRLFSMPKRCFVAVISTFAIAMGLSLLIALYGPPFSIRHSRIVSNDNSKDGHISGLFKISSPPLDVFNKELWLSARIRRAPLSIDAGLSARLNASIKIEITVPMARTNSHPDTHDSTVLWGPIQNFSTILDCPQIVCTEFLLIHLIPVDYTLYTFTIQFHGLASNFKTKHFKSLSYSQIPIQLLQIMDVEFIFEYYTSKFTYFESVLRLIFFILSELILIVFYNSLKQYNMKCWTIEQRYTAMLLLLLMLFNNPLYPLQFLTSSWFLLWLDRFFQCNLICGLLFFWLCVYHGMQISRRTFRGFYFPKLLLTSPIWISMVVISFWKIYREYHEPSFNLSSYTKQLLLIQILFILCGIIYFIWFLIFLIRAYGELRKLPFFDLRLNLLTILTVSVLIVVFTIIALNYGYATDTFVINLQQPQSQLSSFLTTTNLQPRNIEISKASSVKFASISSVHSLWEFSVTYVILNVYLTCLAFIYSVPRNAHPVEFKDNPLISMLNDSDEEVIYESVF